MNRNHKAPPAAATLSKRALFLLRVLSSYSTQLYIVILLIQGANGTARVVLYRQGHPGLMSIWAVSNPAR